MTSEQANKHKEAIKWFCDNPDKSVWRKDFHTNNWHFCRQPAFTYKDIYVQNDEYVEFRKALADGKELQYTDDNGKTWFAHCLKLDTFYSPKDIRIKPKEPEFKIGDWVKRKGYSTIMQINVIDDTYVHSNTSEHYRIENVELWEPKENELCVFWYETDSYYIGRYSSTVKCDTHPYKDAVGYSASGWDNIAPLEFTKTLKTLEGEIK